MKIRKFQLINNKIQINCLNIFKILLNKKKQNINKISII